MSMIPDVFLNLIYTYTMETEGGGEREEQGRNKTYLDIREVSQELHYLCAIEEVRWRGWVGYRRTSRRRG